MLKININYLTLDIMYSALIKRIVNYFRINKNSIIILKCDDLRNIPELPKINFTIRSMNINSQSDIDNWLEIMRISFKRSNLSNKDFFNNIIQHPNYSVIETFFLIDDVKPIAIVSAGYFKKNNKMGVTHYLGISQEYKGQKLGKYMILYALHYLRKNGFNQCEVESYLKYKESLGIHFNFGFKPKTKFENWNTFVNSNPISKNLTKSALLKFYKNFYKNK
jgi:GNAT superfamily N-acetyltransferase